MLTEVRFESLDALIVTSYVEPPFCNLYVLVVLPDTNV